MQCSILLCYWNLGNAENSGAKKFLLGSFLKWISIIWASARCILYFCNFNIAVFVLPLSAPLGLRLLLIALFLILLQITFLWRTVFDVWTSIVSPSIVLLILLYSFSLISILLPHRIVHVRQARFLFSSFLFTLPQCLWSVPCNTLFTCQFTAASVLLIVVFLRKRFVWR